MAERGSSVTTNIGVLNNRVGTIEQDAAKMKSSIEELQRNNEYVDTLVEKMDIAVDRLNDISANISQIVVQQGTRLDNQEKMTDRIIDTLEIRRSETESRISAIHNNVMQEVKSVQESFGNEIKKVEQLVVKVDGKANRLEKWMWTMTGAITVVVFVVEIIMKLLT